jgi:hypothetical protein
MPYRSIHQAQLGRGIPVPGRTRGSRDCGPRSWQVAADQRSAGRKRIGVRALRRRGGVPGPQATSMSDAKRALHGLPVPGRRPLRAYIKRRVSEVKQAARNGRPVVVAIDYGAWNDRDAGTGDPRFRGPHSVVILEQRDRGAGVEWLLMDPLDDGRRAGIERGSRWVRRRDVIAAMLALAGGNRSGIWALVVAGGQRW